MPSITEEYDCVTITASGVVCSNNEQIIKVIRPKALTIDVSRSADAHIQICIERRG